MIDQRALSVLNKLNQVGRARFSDLQSVVRNARTLSAKLKLLRSLNLVEVTGNHYRLTREGRSILLHLTEADRILRGTFKVNVERVPTVFSEVLKKYCELLYEKYAKRLRAVVLFGSVARGSWDRDSDIDLLVIVDDWKKPSWERTKELVEVRSQLRETPEYKEVLEKGFFPIIQNYPLDTEEAKAMHRIYLDASIEAIILYEKEGFASELLRSVRNKLKKAGAVRVQLPSGAHYWLLGK